MKIISNCPLCEEHSLHIIGENELKTQQCIACGYVTAEKYNIENNDVNTNVEYAKLSAEMKNWSKKANDKIWLPTMMTLHIGMLYPLDIVNTGEIKSVMKWAFAPMIDITEEEKQNYPNEQGGYYEKRIDTDNSLIYETFLEGMAYLTNKVKELEKSNNQNLGVKLPKLKKA